jgi:hypothetical protein
MRRTTILSHGGKHGRQRGTYVKGSAAPQAATKLMPSGLAGAEVEPGTPAPTPERPKEAPKAVQPSIKPPPASQGIKPPKSAGALRRWSLGRLQALADQEGIEAAPEVKTSKKKLGEILISHLGLK